MNAQTSRTPEHGPHRHGDHHDRLDHGDHIHDAHQHAHAPGLRGLFAGLFNPHSHDHAGLAADSAFAAHQAGIRTVWLALLILALTAILQLLIVAASGSVALLGDTAHNVGDALNSLPLLVAFYLARRAATQRYTYGFGRAEDIAGIFIVLSIVVSAAIVFWEGYHRLLNPQPIANVGWVAAAALIGFVGNETVAALQIRAGRRIGSEALVADGLHARTDGLTSLAVLAAAAGSWLGFPLVDPIVGLLIGVVILVITWDAAKRITYRLMDAIQPEQVERLQSAVSSHPGVARIDRLRLRWVGHQLQGDLRLAPRPTADHARLNEELRHLVHQAEPLLSDLTIEHVDTP